MNCCLVASIPILLWAFASYRSHRAAMTGINRFLARLPLTILVALNLSHLAIRQFLSLYPTF